MIFGGVVLRHSLRITNAELLELGHDELLAKYRWILEAPNIQHRLDTVTGEIVVRSKTPVITTMRRMSEQAA